MNPKSPDEQTTPRASKEDPLKAFFSKYQILLSSEPPAVGDILYYQDQVQRVCAITIFRDDTLLLAFEQVPTVHAVTPGTTFIKIVPRKG